LRRVIRYIVARTYKPWLVKYLTRTRMYSYKGISLQIPPEVFHPGFFSSTKLLLRYISKEHLSEKKFLELGAGAGLLAVYAAKKGAVVTATDISPFSVKCLRRNAETNGVEVQIIQSDLFEAIPRIPFDYILINPPYYKKNPSSDVEFAWYCGENGEYFQKLFSCLRHYVHPGTEVLMVLCDGCDLEMIRQMAAEHFFNMEVVYTRGTVIEKNFIFRIQTVK
jgi:release factor glutamine methyltransferase